MKPLRHILEASIILPLYYILMLIPIDLASNLMGFLARKIGQLTSAHKTALRNLQAAFPNNTKQQNNYILRGVWDNLGRIAGELPHINSMSDAEFRKRVKIINPPKHPNKSALIISAHYGNFELAARIFHEAKIPIHLVYRPANNQFVDDLINNNRAKFGAKLISKGVSGVRKMLDALQNNESVGMLIDQRTNTGIDVPFLGITAKTTPLPANLIKKYNIPVFYMKMHRDKGAHFTIEFSKAIHFEKGLKPEEIMEKMGEEIASWIKKDPSQWFWVHKRWGKL